MSGMRIVGAVCAGILAASLGTLAACGGEPESKDAPAAETINAASVSIALVDENGTRVGDGSGVLIAPRLVLTSGHLIAGKGSWVVTSADGKRKVTGSRGVTYDWRTYDSSKAHPRLHDVGVIYLDDSIKLDSYPAIVGDRQADGAKATRLRGTGAGFEPIEATLGRVSGSPNSYLADSGSDVLDTGGAVYNDRGIVGIVSGKGLSTGKLYIARTDLLTKWLAPKVACAGGSLGPRTYAPPQQDKSEEICEDGGTPSTSTSGGPPGSSGGPPKDGDKGPKTCGDDGDGYCHGRHCSPSNDSGKGGTSTSKPDDGSSGSNGNQNPRDDEDPSGGGETEPGGNGGPNTNQNPGGDPDPNGKGGPNTTKNPSDRGPSYGGAGSKGKGADTDKGEACQGPTDNPETCPVEADGCAGEDCGGGQPDNEIDYGNCACGRVSTGTRIR